MSILKQLREAGLVARGEFGKVVIDGLDRLPPEEAGRLLALAKNSRPGLLAEILAGACPYSDEQLAEFNKTWPHLICCPASKSPWDWRYREVCGTRCETRCGREVAV